MKISRILSAGCALVTTLLAGATSLTVDTQAGALKDKISGQADGLTELTVTGKVNAADLEFIRYGLPDLTSLNLSGTQVAEYQGERLVTGRLASAADVVPEYSFTGSQITTLSLPAGITEIGDGAFAGSHITAVELPQTVTKIGVSAFADCPSLTAAVIPSGVTAIGTGAFRNCTALKSVTISGSVAEIPESAFAGCSALTTVAFPASLRGIGSQAFAGTGLTAADLSGCRNLRTIGPWAFANCASLSTVSLPSVGSLDLQEGAFFRNVTLGNNLNDFAALTDKINNYAFTDNAAMKVTKFEDSSVATVGDYALRGFATQDTITFPSTLEHIGTRGMAGWNGLQKVDARQLGTNVPSLGDEVWHGVNQSQIPLLVKEEQETLFSESPQWKEFNVTVIKVSDIENIVADNGASQVTGSIHGDVLTLESKGADILGFQIYDLSGRMIAMPRNTPAQTVTAPVGTIDSPVMVVRVMLSDGTTTALKLAR